MRDLPPPVLEYLRTLIVENRSLAYLQIDKGGCLSNWGGNLAAYGMTGLHKGLPVREQVVFLEGLFPLQDPPLLLPCVETGSGLFADIHIFSGEDGNWVLLLDATPEEVQRRLFHQKANDLSLRYEQQSKILEQYACGAAHEPLLVSLFTALNMVLMERQEKGSFRLLGSLPEWFFRLYPEAASLQEDLRPGERFFVLGNFIVDAEQLWQERGAGRLRSGLWIETDGSGNEYSLEASAVCVRERKILLIELLDVAFAEKQSLIQKARERSLQYHYLETRLQKLLNQLCVGIFRSTPDGRLLEANPAFLRMLNVDSAQKTQTQALHELCGQLEDGTQVPNRPRQSQPLQRRELQLRRADDSLLWVSLTATRSLTATGETVIDGLIEDITERKRAEEARKEEAKVAEALLRVGWEMITLLDTPAILNRLCELTTKALGCDVSHVFLWQPKEDTLVPMSGYGNLPEEWETLRLLKIPRARVMGLFSSLESEDVVQQTLSPHQGPLVAELQKQFNATAGLYMALRRGRMIIGCLSASYRGRNEHFTPHQERIARGIAQFASMALQNAHLVEELEHANRLKEEFLAMFSHELRTPLQVIIGYSGLLLDGTFGSLTAEQTDFMRRVDKYAQELFTLITTILDLNRLQRGQLPLDFTDVSLSNLLREIEIETQDWFEKPGLHAVWNIAPEPLLVHTDCLKLKIVIRNLIHNAVKFTEQGNIIVDAHLCTGGVEICVSDTGIGIAPEMLPIIFEPFRQADSSTSRHYGGLGLGLHIVQQLLELLGGTITVESKVGHGSTFRVLIPPSKPSERDTSE
jgi:PAS domain S-box-containing protein